MKKILLLLTFFLLVIASLAQIGGGLKAGFNLEKTGGNFVDGNFKYGFHLGGYLCMGFSEKLSFQPEMQISTGGAKNEFEKGRGSYNRETVLRLSYLNVPLSLQYSFGRFNVFTGPQVGFLLRAKTEISETVTSKNIKTVTTSVKDSRKFFKDVDLCLNFGAGFNLGKWTISGRYSIGVLNLYNDFYSKYWELKNKTIQVSASYKLFGK